MPAFDNLNSWVSSQLAASSGPAAWGLLFVAGALASLLPCVYPLYPITAAFLRSRGGTNRFAHPTAYYVGLGISYGSFGLIAALTGGAFNEALRLPIANLVIGAALVLLALATVGLLHFPILSQPVDGSRPGLLWTLIMGGGAGFLSSACVGPVVVSILLGIVTSSSGLTVGLVASAMTKMAIFGLGVGLPLLLIGVFGVGLPRGGRWMVSIQWIFGFLIAYFALGYVWKALSGFGLSESMATSVVTGALLLTVAVYSAQDSQTTATHRVTRSLWALVAVAGFFVMGRGMLGNAVAVNANPATSTPTVTTEVVGNLTWHLDKQTAYEDAARRGKPVFIDFHGDWCTNCKAFQKTTQTDSAFNAALSEAVLLKVYDSAPLFEEFKNDPRFVELKVGLPFFVVTDPAGNLVYKTSDFSKTNEMALFLRD